MEIKIELINDKNEIECRMTETYKKEKATKVFTQLQEILTKSVYEKCNCYEEVTQHERVFYNSTTGEPVYKYITKSICNGTREKDECSCKGNKVNCDFCLQK